MTGRLPVDDWLTRARSNLSRAQAGKVAPEVLYEDLCFDCQQAAEKALKALCVSRAVAFPPTHSIGLLCDLVQQSGLTVPATVGIASELTEFAVMTRYPGEYEPVNEDEWRCALARAETVLQWVQQQLS